MKIDDFCEEPLFLAEISATSPVDENEGEKQEEKLKVAKNGTFRGAR